MDKEISVAKDFTVAPAGRFKEDGPFSGELFRVAHLVPALRECDVVIVNLDGGEGYGSSFFEEAFGGLVRRDGFDVTDLHRRLKIETQDEGWKQEIWQYIDDAGRR